MDARASQNHPCRLLFLIWLILAPSACLALESAEVLVIANSQAENSLDLADHYMQRRRIPPGHLVRLQIAAKENCSRQEYEDLIRKPVRQALTRLGPGQRIRCLVVMYGMPLVIRSLAPVPGKPALKPDETRTTRAAVDSELALVLTDKYPLEGWLPNPYFVGFANQKTLLKRDNVLIVSRLDGPDPVTVRRLIDDALAVEQEGLHGRAYFDARWPKPLEKNLSGYALYDASLHAAADSVRSSGRMEEVRLDAREELFQYDEAPQAALYCGWYSLSRYVDAFTWVRGAIGYHIASGECTTLKQPGSQVWCKRMLEKGVAATIGPVFEPYVQAFPLPDLFFATLADGYLSLGETYLISLPFLSWQMVLIGDPLYQPFAPR